MPILGITLAFWIFGSLISTVTHLAYLFFQTGRERQRNLKNMKIYTKTGDQGTTSLFGGKRVSKSDLRIDSYGTVDELNSYIGLLRDQEVNHSRKEILVEIQDRLFTIGSILATEPGNTKVKIPSLLESDITLLENEMDKMDAVLPPMRFFVLPGGHPSVSFGHVARTVCRRAERLVIALHHIEIIDPLVIKYLNRLSDYLFVLCRMMAHELKIDETPWKARM
jgi:cob(I)alamin adenosyltransferase